MKHFLCLLLLTYCFSTALADVEQEEFSIKGTLGESIQFELHLNLEDRGADGQGILTGYTYYHRKSGTSTIRAFGYCDEKGMHVTEFHNHHVCGQFDFTIENWQEGGAVHGQWSLGDKVLSMQGVQYQEIAAELSNTHHFELLDHENLPYHQSVDGTYGYTYKEGGKDRKKSLTVRTFSDSTLWTFTLDTLCFEVKTPIRGEWYDVTEFGNYQFMVEYIGDALYLYRTNPEAGVCKSLPQGLNPEGIYPLQSTLATYSETRNHLTKLKPELESASSYYLDIPYFHSNELLGTSVINDSIAAYVNLHLDLAPDERPNYKRVLPGLADNFFVQSTPDEELLEYVNSLDEENTNIRYTHIDHPSLVNLELGHYIYNAGGAHGFYSSKVITFVKKSGKGMTWTDWFTSPDKIQNLVIQYMREQNADTYFYEELPSLPASSPYYSDEGLVFQYLLYEAAPYSEGQIFCTIPFSVLQPYMTTQAKRLIKK